jgi:two-component system, chemotaxis family, protein-glutamate methylesterase/glutaminase
MAQIRFPVVALVCSAGGLDALSRVLAPLPATLPAALLILQHTTPDVRSHLADILDQRTALSVVPAVGGSLLTPGVALVAPAGSHLLVTVEGGVEIIRSGGTPPYRPSADLLLTTLALAARSQAIAVVLTGRGNDAATGVTAVHHFGGQVIASDEASSSEFAMPAASISRGHAVDHVVALEEIAALLERLTTE